MKKFLFIVLLIFGLGLGACSVDNHVTTASSWLKAVENGKLGEASSLMVDSDLEEFSASSSARFQDEFSEKYGLIKSASYTSFVPLTPLETGALGVEEGNMIFYMLDSESRGSEPLKFPVVKLGESWKVVWEAED